MRGRLLVAAVLAALAVAGCGATPPQAPMVQAERLSAALGGISEACGEADQVNAFDGDPAALATIEAAASSRALEFAGVYGHNPGWIYQSNTLRKIRHDSISALRDCGLDRAANVLEGATAGR